MIKEMRTKAEADVVDIADSGIISGYLSKFDNVDSYGDVVRKGAFTESLELLKTSGRKLPVLWQHNRDEPIGYFIELKEDDVGLYFEAQLLIEEVVKASEAYALLKSGVITGMSIGYFVKEYKVIVGGENEFDSLELIKLDLREGSVVTFPANPETHVESVKAEELQGASLSKTESVMARITKMAALDKLALVVSKL